MRKTVQARYIGGVFHPVEPVDWLEENRQVTVVVDVPDRAAPLDGWVGGLSDEDAREMLRTIEQEFEQVDPDDWK